jgi:hypothetical protein
MALSNLYERPRLSQYARSESPLRGVQAVGAVSREQCAPKGANVDSCDQMVTVCIKRGVIEILAPGNSPYRAHFPRRSTRPRKATRERATSVDPSSQRLNRQNASAHANQPIWTPGGTRCDTHMITPMPPGSSGVGRERTLLAQTKRPRRPRSANGVPPRMREPTDEP